ncbi:MAG: AMP-binding protein [Gammaproteobacteria bacterium]
MLRESYWPASDEIALNETSTASVLRDAAVRWPERVALIDAGGPPTARTRWTYAELLAEAERTARALANRFAPGAHVAVWAANCPEWVILQFGLALAGLVMVTVNPACRAAELGYVLRQSRARGVFHQPHYRGLDMGAAVAAVRAEPSVALDHAIAFEELDAFVAGHDSDTALPTIDPRAPAMIQYTSGTTGAPKGALLNHYSVTNNPRMMVLLKELDEHTVNLAVAPLFHSGGCERGRCTMAHRPG